MLSTMYVWEFHGNGSEQELWVYSVGLCMHVPWWMVLYQDPGSELAGNGGFVKRRQYLKKSNKKKKKTVHIVGLLFLRYSFKVNYPNILFCVWKEREGDFRSWLGLDDRNRRGPAPLFSPQYTDSHWNFSHIWWFKYKTLTCTLPYMISYEISTAFPAEKRSVCGVKVGVAL